MMLLTKKDRSRLPKLYSTQDDPNPMVWVKFFDPCGCWTWYGVEFDGKDEFFGYVEGYDKELGYFYLSELESYRGPLGLAIERDRYFEPCRLNELRDQ